MPNETILKIFVNTGLICMSVLFVLLVVVSVVMVIRGFKNK